jgi:hypothetical protein
MYAEIINGSSLHNRKTWLYIIKLMSSSFLNCYAYLLFCSHNNISFFKITNFMITKQSPSITLLYSAGFYGHIHEFLS